MKRRAFPYQRVARLWKNGRTIAEIGERIGYVDRDREDGDRFHSLRNFLRRMHSRGYRNHAGKLLKLPYRMPRKLVRAMSGRVKQALAVKHPEKAAKVRSAKKPAAKATA
jgi:hypothetical protein